MVVEGDFHDFVAEVSFLRVTHMLIMISLFMKHRLFLMDVISLYRDCIEKRKLVCICKSHGSLFYFVGVFVMKISMS